MKNIQSHIAPFSQSNAVAALVILMTLMTVTALSAEDSVPNQGFLHKGVVGKIVKYFDDTNKIEITRKPQFSFIGGPHYSSDTGFGVGLVAAGIYADNPQDTTLQPSNISIMADLTTSLFFKFGLDGLHLYSNDNKRINYSVSFTSYKTYYWGVGFKMARMSENKTKYLLLDLNFEADHEWRFGGNWLGGPLMSVNYVAARKIENPEIWGDQPTRFISAGVGGKIQYDSRDNYTAPTCGSRLELVQRVFPQWFGNSTHAFGETEVALNHYRTVWKGGVLAGRLHGVFSYGNTPWGMMPSLGGSRTMRGYYEGQYRDKCETDATIELRQHIKGRSGIVVWGGAGAVYPSFGGFNGRDILPTYGVGYRWEFKHLTNVRIDLGFGKGTWGVVLNINEAF